MRLCASFASCFTCSMIARSVRVPSNVSRIVSYMVVPFLVDFCRVSSSAGDNMPGRIERVRHAVNVHCGDQDSTGPTRNEQEPAKPPDPHAFPRACEMQKRKHGEGKLQGQHALTEGEQIGHAALSSQADNQYGRQDR